MVSCSAFLSAETRRTVRRKLYAKHVDEQKALIEEYSKYFTAAQNTVASTPDDIRHTDAENMVL